MNASVDVQQRSLTTTYAVELEIPFDLAMVAYSAFVRSERSCTKTASRSFFNGVSESVRTEGGVDEQAPVEIEMRYWDKGWRTHLVKALKKKRGAAGSSIPDTKYNDLIDLLENA